MKINRIQKALVLMTISVGVFAAGCELVVDFDRTKIPVELSDAAIPDVSVPETNNTPSDSGTVDSGSADSGSADTGAADANDQ